MRRHFRSAHGGHQNSRGARGPPPTPIPAGRVSSRLRPLSCRPRARSPSPRVAPGSRTAEHQISLHRPWLSRRHQPDLILFVVFRSSPQPRPSHVGRLDPRTGCIQRLLGECGTTLRAPTDLGHDQRVARLRGCPSRVSNNRPVDGPRPAPRSPTCRSTIASPTGPGSASKL